MLIPTENFGCTLLPILLPLFPGITQFTRTPISGKVTAVSRNPIPAHQILFPALKPSVGGKIKFPAPKNMENIVNPTANISRVVNFFKAYSPLIYIFFHNNIKLSYLEIFILLIIM